MYTLFGAQVSYFTGKARAFLQYSGLPFEEKLATREVYQQIIVPKIGWPVIPVIVTPEGDALQDTSDIIDALDGKSVGPSVYPEGPQQKLASLMMEVIGDEWLVIPAMHYRWTYNREFAYAEFGAISAPDASPEEQFAIGKKNAVNFEGALPVLGINGENGAAIESTYHTLLELLDAHFGNHDFLLGERPTIGDFGLYGPLFAHQYRDPASGALMKEKAPRLAAWVERMRDLPDGKTLGGELLANDEVPESLAAILRFQLEEFAPVLASTADALVDWAREQEPGSNIPRAIGMHPFYYGGVASQRMIFPFNLWMLQRPMDHLTSLDGADLVKGEAAMKHWGGEALLGLTWPKLTRKAFKLHLA